MFQQDVFQGPGTGTFTSHTFEILFMLLVAGLIGLWLGWVLWSRYRQEAEKLRLENTSLTQANAALRQESDDMKAKLTDAETERSTLENRIKTMTWEADTQRSQFTILQSDMEKILARNRQLETELGLSLEPETALAETIPLEVDAAFLPLDGPDAADTARADQPEKETVEPKVEGEVESHVAPEPAPPAEPESDGVVFVTPVSRESMIPISELGDAPVAQAPLPEKKKKATEEAAPIVATVLGGPRDDLKIVEGIGPKIEQILFSAGITTYGQLAATSVQQLKDILAEAGSRYVMHDPGTWSAQALLAANGEWENLKAYQDFLNAGKRPDKN